jgi:cell division control protein 24
MNFLFRSSIAETNAWSIFSGLSFGQVSTIAVITLPIYPEDLANPQHYDFGQHHIPQKSANPTSNYDQSIFHECLDIKLLLSQIPAILDIFQVQEKTWKQNPGLPDLPDIDSLSLLKRTFNRGYPLLILFNELETRPLWDPGKYKGGVKGPQMAGAAALQFLDACKEKFNLSNDGLPFVSEFLSNININFLSVISSSIISRIAHSLSATRPFLSLNLFYRLLRERANCILQTFRSFSLHITSPLSMG